MKKKSMLIVAILLMSIGFASISTTLIINGNAKVSENQDDFSVIFTAATLDGKDVYSSVVNDTKKIITFETSELKTLNQTSVLNYEVTNNSNNYDAEVKINCKVKDNAEAVYTSIKNELEGNATVVKAKTSLNGTLTVTLNKTSTEEVSEEYVCELAFNAVERNSVGENTTFEKNVKVGDYVTYTPSETSVIPDATLTGYTECLNASKCGTLENNTQNSLNPSLNTIWRVLSVDNGKIEIISNELSNAKVVMYGKTAYINMPKALNMISSKYINSKFAISARTVGYNGQTEVITDTSKIDSVTNPFPDSYTKDNTYETTGGGDMLYEKDYNVLKTLNAVTTNVVGTTTNDLYWTASRRQYAATNVWSLGFRLFTDTGAITFIYFTESYTDERGFVQEAMGNYIRPVVTLKSNLDATGNGAIDNPWVLI